MFALVKKCTGVTLAKSKSYIFLLVFVLFGLISFNINAKNIESAEINHKIIISGFEFTPSRLIVKVGDTVTWINKDIASHNVTISNSQKTISPNLAVGQKFIYKVVKAFEYECGLHPSMTGEIILKVGKP